VTTRTGHERTRRTLLLFAVLACGACAQAADDTMPPASVAAGATLEQIDALIGDARCSADADCRVVGVGAKACGGPQSYRAWSAAQTDAQALQRLVDRYAAARAAEMRRQGVRSTCDMAPVPAVLCRPHAAADGSGRCSLVPARQLPLR